ncbi:MAG: acetate--CoA ligase family protein [Breznakibacter sp.]
MVNQQLINPDSIVVVGASDNTEKPGGKILKNLLDTGYSGQLYVVNAKQDKVQGVVAHQTLESLPAAIDLGVLAIPAADCPWVVEELTKKHRTRAFVVVSAGFSEEGEKGRDLEKQLAMTVDKANACLIGPNCIGVVTPYHSSVFSTPVPKPTPKGADLISASGATAVFIMEMGLKIGLRFNHVFSVGNGAQTSVEDVLAYMDTHYDATSQSQIKLLYFESIKHPQKLLKHARSLTDKGCKLVAIKAGTSQAGKRAAMSHTGAMAGNDQAVGALFRKAGIIRCHGRDQMVHIAGILLHAPYIGKSMAIITHAGGPAVMLTDTLEKGGFQIPKLEGKTAENLLSKLHHGSSVANPIDILATGTPEQLASAIDACENQFHSVDGMVVIFGSPGLFPVDGLYDTIHQKMGICKKPVIPVLPSVMNAQSVIERFKQQGHIAFSDEVAVGHALVSVLKAPKTFAPVYPRSNHKTNLLQDFLKKQNDGFLTAFETNQLLELAGIPLAREIHVSSADDIPNAVHSLGFPLVAKSTGPLHKTEVGGVITRIKDLAELRSAYVKLMAIDGATGVSLQPHLTGHELFVGAKREPGYGHLIVFGLGGIYVEMIRDVACVLLPASPGEIAEELRKLRIYPLFKGFRGQAPIDEAAFCELIGHVSELLVACPEIDELDLNPIFATTSGLFCVDARLSVKKIAPSG